MGTRGPPTHMDRQLRKATRTSVTHIATAAAKRYTAPLTVRHEQRCSALRMLCSPYRHLDICHLPLRASVALRPVSTANGRPTAPVVTHIAEQLNPHPATCYCLLVPVCHSQRPQPLSARPCAGARERDHANARELGAWNRLRQAARAGNRSLIDSEYRKQTPLGNGPTAHTLQQRQLPVVRQPRGEAAAAAAGTAGTAGAAEGSGGGSGSATAAAAAAAAPAQQPRGTAPGVAAPAAAAAAAAAAAPSSFHNYRSQVERLAADMAAADRARAEQEAARAAEVARAAEEVERAQQAAATAAGLKSDPGNEVALPTGPCRLIAMPDPALEMPGHVFELGTLRLGVKVGWGARVVAPVASGQLVFLRGRRGLLSGCRVPCVRVGVAVPAQTVCQGAAGLGTWQGKAHIAPTGCFLSSSRWRQSEFGNGLNRTPALPPRKPALLHSVRPAAWALRPP